MKQNQSSLQVILDTAPWGLGGYKLTDEEGNEFYGYGFYRPENPNDFFPDSESCTEKEIEAHRLACENWNKSDKNNNCSEL